MATYLECCEELQFQHGPIEKLSNTDTWHNVHSLPIAISNSLDLLVVALKNTLHVYKCSQYASALITKSTDLARGEMDVDRSKTTNLSLNSNILAIEACKTKSLLAYQLDTGEAGVLELHDLAKKPVPLPELRCFSWSGDKLICYHTNLNNELVIYNFEKYTGICDLPENISCKTPVFSSDIYICALETPQIAPFWAVGHANPPFFITVTADGYVSERIDISTEQHNCNCRLAGICPISENQVLTALLIKTDTTIDSAISLYCLSKDTKTNKQFTVENELFIQDESFGDSLADPFGGTVKFVSFEPLGIVLVFCSHTSQALVLGHGKLWNNEWNVLGMDEGCSLEVSDSLNCPRGIAISTTFRETLHRRHAQVDTPPLVNPPLVLLAQRDCTISLHYIVSPHSIEVTTKVETAGAKVLSADNLLSHDSKLSAYDKPLSPTKNSQLSPLVERFFREGVNSGDGLPIYERGIRDTLIEALSQAFHLVDQSLDGLDRLSTEAIEPMPAIPDIKISADKHPNLQKEDYNLSHVRRLIAEFVCIATKQLYCPPLQVQMDIIDLEAKVRSRVKWLKNPSTKCNDFLFQHFSAETTAATLAYTNYLLEPGFFSIGASLCPYQELNSLVPIAEEFRPSQPGADGSESNNASIGVEEEATLYGSVDAMLAAVSLQEESRTNGKETTYSTGIQTLPPQAPVLRVDAIDEIMGNSCIIKPQTIQGFQNLFRCDEEKAKLRNTITDRIRIGHVEADVLRVDDKKVVHKNWPKSWPAPPVSTIHAGGSTFVELSAVKFRAERERIAKEGTAKEGITKEGITKEGITKEGITKEGITKEGITKEGIAKEGIAKEGITKEGITKEGIAKEGITKEGITKEGITKEGIATTAMAEGGPMETADEMAAGAMETAEPANMIADEMTVRSEDGPNPSAFADEPKPLKEADVPIQTIEQSVSETQDKSPAANSDHPSVKADFSAMLLEPVDAIGGGAFRRQTYGFGESSLLSKTLDQANNRQSGGDASASSFGGFSSFATCGGSLADLAQKASSGSGFADFCSPGSFGSFGSFGYSAFSTGTGIVSKGFTDTGFGQGNFKGFTSSAGGFGEGGPKTFSQSASGQQQIPASGPPSEGDLWNKPRWANPLN
ncbi:conserved Plasmodium membrane protein, unknown function [Babesia microti strain RI]|uniref:Uncharacterized protein n=1 Tax=Babesia microti (strain RI) TaxID=1133968 RepID=A0A1R4AB97_BABMR|nr:conserved Plasmodium membrane protein, unknown function [Babesia microti strain RI]SJK86224.1 conserved Plasmodium membrane protein, unknown function [Babesia microti strain RI]|eukprot:XP_021338408.1 conserved Plasmodium membrane protein, unknown function [Babesia microti strain RI]